MTTILGHGFDIRDFQLIMRLNTSTLIVALTALTLAYAPGHASLADDFPSASTQTAPAGKQTAETASILDTEPKATSEVTIWVRVQLDDKAVDSFTVFPYPVKPPANKNPIKPLSDKPRTVSDQLLGAGYLNRVAHQPVFPTNGWRWQYAYETAIRHSGNDLPKTIFSMYRWRNNMVQYMIPEIMRINAIEKKRKATYEKAILEHKRSFTDLENEATRNGLYPVDVRMGRAFKGQVTLSAGTWWISGSRKVPGLVYYWWLPITVTAGDKSQIVLNENNALLIQGGW